MRPRFGRPEAARHEIVEGILSPEERRFLLSPGIAARNAGPALPGATMPMHLQKILKGWSPEKMLPLTLGNRDEDSMRAAD
jgi:hypothetical protein